MKTMRQYAWGVCGASPNHVPQRREVPVPNGHHEPEVPIEVHSAQEEGKCRLRKVWEVGGSVLNSLMKVPTTQGMQTKNQSFKEVISRVRHAGAGVPRAACAVPLNEQRPYGTRRVWDSRGVCRLKPGSREAEKRRLYARAAPGKVALVAR